MQLERQFPFLLKLSVCLSASLTVQHFSRLCQGSQIPLLTSPRQRLKQVPGGCPPRWRGRNEVQTGMEFRKHTHSGSRLGVRWSCMQAAPAVTDPTVPPSLHGFLQPALFPAEPLPDHLGSSTHLALESRAPSLTWNEGTRAQRGAWASCHHTAN